MTPERKLELIAKIVELQSEAQNYDADGPDARIQYQSDAYLAMEAIGLILQDAPGFRSNGAVRTYLD
jgi:hypothetical protein